MKTEGPEHLRHDCQCGVRAELPIKKMDGFHCRGCDQITATLAAAKDKPGKRWDDEPKLIVPKKPRIITP